MTQTIETKTPYGSIFRSGDREWFPGSVEEFRTAQAWEENQALANFLISKPVEINPVFRIASSTIFSFALAIGTSGRRNS